MFSIKGNLKIISYTLANISNIYEYQNVIEVRNKPKCVVIEGIEQKSNVLFLEWDGSNEV